MFKKNSFLELAITVLVCVFLLVACNNKDGVSSTLDMETLFSLDYGNFEDELNVFDLASVGSVDTQITMRDGFFYIANGESKKIMEMTSYGDLICLLYNAENNPVPSFIGDGSSSNATRKAIAYPFNKITSIALDGRKNLYVVDKLPAERFELSEDEKQQLFQVVLWFDENGNFVDYLGQDGPGGIPFPYIKSIYATQNNEVVVECLSTDGPVIYWMSDKGYLLYKIPVKEQYVPNPFVTEEDDDYWLCIENIVPDYSERRLYIKVDYYTSFVDEASHIQSGVDYYKTLLYPFDISTGSFGEPITVPAYHEEMVEGFAVENYSIPYDFLGVTENGWYFFVVSTKDGFNIQMIQDGSLKMITRTLKVASQDNLYHSFNLSAEGILSLLLVKSEKATINWWRTDELIQAVIKN